MNKLDLYFFQLKVSGNNLVNVCKLVFKVSKDEKNDFFFLEGNILGIRVRTHTHIILLRRDRNREEL